MKVIIAGSRSIDAIRNPLTRSHDRHDYSMLQLRIAKAVRACGFSITKVIAGGAPGVDRAAVMWAKGENLPYEEIKADWNTFGLGAGKERNHRMAHIADALIALWDGKSAGTLDMINYMATLEKPAKWITIPRAPRVN